MRLRSWLLGRPLTIVIAAVGLSAIVWMLGSKFLELKSNSQVFNTWTEDLTGDCAVVLTGGAQRLREGFDLLSQKRVKKLIVSGVNPESRLLDIFPLLPFYGNIDKKDIVLERLSRNTYENGKYSMPLIETLNCKEVLIVTSSVHMDRALRAFRAQAPESIMLMPAAVYPGRQELEDQEILLEVVKHFFYSLWAY